MPPVDSDLIEHAAQLIAQSDALIIAAGAGMGVDSGLPDFRGSDGFWRAYPALSRARLSFTDIASLRTFAVDPGMAWGFYGHRLQLYRETIPHEGFAILKRWADHLLHGAFVFTSNVDGQFQKAGFDEHRIHECHGSIHWLQCLGPCSDRVWSAAELVPVIDDDECQWIGALPRCPHCAGTARPNVLMFGDGAWIDRRSTTQESRLANWLTKVHRPVVVELGAGSYIRSVRTFTETVIHRHRGRVVRINPREAEVPTPFDVGLPIGALDGLVAIDEMIDFA